MLCENVFCVYNNDKECMVAPEINIAGSCEDCIYVNIDKEVLKAAKIEILKRWGDDELIEMLIKGREE